MTWLSDWLRIRPQLEVLISVRKARERRRKQRDQKDFAGSAGALACYVSVQLSRALSEPRTRKIYMV